MASLPPIGLSTLVTQWQLNGIVLTLGLASSLWYLAMYRRLKRQSQTWARRRVASFLLGVGCYLWVGNGFLNAYSGTVMWVWSVQVLTLFLVVPVMLMAGQPVELARLSATRRSLLDRAATSLPSRVIGHRLVGPAVVPIVCTLLFFAHWADLYAQAWWIAAITGAALLAVGCLIAAPLTAEDSRLGSLAIGLSLAISVLELLTDAIPGIVLRLQTHLVTYHFAVRHEPWAMSPLSDQKLSGAILWTVAEVLDLPFLIIIFRQWVRADEREARRVDQMADRSAGAAVEAGHRGQNAADQPWWLTDPQMMQRLNVRRGVEPEP